MTEGPDQNQDTVERLQGELDELLRQHEQYTLALDAAMDPRTSLRLQRTLERLDDEIEGLREALKPYDPPEAEYQDSGQAILPEWGDDDEDEPATSVYTGLESDPNGVFVGRSLQGFVPGHATALPAEDPPTVSLKAPWAESAEAASAPVHARPGQSDSLPTALQPRPAGPLIASAIIDPPTTTVSPPIQQPPMPGHHVGQMGTNVATPSGEAPQGLSGEAPQGLSGEAPQGLSGQAPQGLTGEAPQGLSGQAPQATPDQPYQRPAAPPGGASFTSLPPPAGLEDAPWGHTEIVPPTYQTQPQPSTQPMGAPPVSPFNAPPPSAPHPGSSSPFGEISAPSSSPASGSGFSPAGGYGLTDAGDKDEWSVGSRLLLAFLVLLFLGGVGWILAQGP